MRQSVSKATKPTTVYTLATGYLKNNMNIYKFLGLDFEPTFKGNAFQSKPSNSYLLKKGIITLDQYFDREYRAYEERCKSTRVDLIPE